MLFAHHPTSPTAIDDLASRARETARASAALAQDAQGQVRSADGAVSGTLAAPLLNSPAPVVASGTQVSGAAELFDGCMRRWSCAVALYNLGIDELNARHATASAVLADTGNIAAQGARPQDAIPSDADVRAKLSQDQARLDGMLDDEATQIAALLDEGPTDHALGVLAQGGDKPLLWDEFWELFREGMRSQIIPPDDLSAPDFVRWLALRASIGLWALTDWYTIARAGWIMGRATPLDGLRWATPWWTWSPSTFPVNDPQFWSKVAAGAKGATLTLAGLSAFVQQWREDSDRPDLQTSDKAVRALSVGTFTSAVVGIGGSVGFQGGLAGARFGAAIGIGGSVGFQGGLAGARFGAAIGIGGGPVGMAVGALVGATVGAVAGWAAADLATESLMPDEPVAPVPPVPAPPGEIEQPLPPVEPPLLVEPPPPIEVPDLTAPPRPPFVDVELGDSYWTISESLLPWDATEREILELKDELVEANPHTGPEPDLILPDTVLTVPQR